MLNDLLLLPLTAMSLAFYGGGGPTPMPPSTVGVWEGTITAPGLNSPVLLFTFEQSNTPNRGDFSGTIAEFSDPAGTKFSGNTLQGTLVVSDPAGGLTCKGAFTKFVRYEGVCVLTEGSANMNLVLNKR
ncbi:hypothetical protein ACFFLM_04470 [Deinococcus oregonensis]|uniref:Uncharacterized protein n=1 Tax=Deinococcus oregonensis TaxID=1805970 RepID=A0ABV6AW41_9DEIO